MRDGCAYMLQMMPESVQTILPVSRYARHGSLLSALIRLKADKLQSRFIRLNALLHSPLPLRKGIRICLGILIAILFSTISIEVYADDATQTTNQTATTTTPSSFTLIIRMTPAVCALYPELQNLRQCQDGFTLTISSLQAERLNGKHLENCSHDSTNLSPLQERVVERVMPDKQLRDEDWDKNGSCTGMSPTAYFRTIATYAQRLKVPPELASPRDTVLSKAYIINRLEQLNPGLTEKSISLHCTPYAGHEYPVLTELRSCYTTQGQYDACIVQPKATCPSNVVIHGSP